MSAPYTYPGSDALINKRGIRDGATLHKFEHQRVVFAQTTLFENYLSCILQKQACRAGHVLDATDARQGLAGLVEYIHTI